MEALHTETRSNGYTVEIHHDDDAESPRQWSQTGTMVHWHRRYSLGDREATSREMEALERGGWRLLIRYLRRYEGATMLLKLGLIDHSGLSMYADGGPSASDPQGWDSGTVGFIYDSAKGREETGATDIEAALRAEIEEYDAFLQGQTYGFIVLDPAGEQVDSCWGFLETEWNVDKMYVTTEARAIADSYVDNAAVAAGVAFA